MTDRNPEAAEARIDEFRLGWPIVLAAAFGVGVGLTGIPFYTLGTFLKPLSTDFHWTRTQVSLGTAFLHAGTAVTSPFLGGLVDRHGARRIGLISLAGLALGFIIVSRSGPSLASFYAAWLILALLGCGTTPLTWTRLVVRHFDTRRGLALGLALAGTGVASILAPPLCSLLIAIWGWRTAYACLGGFTLLVALPVIAISARRQPVPYMLAEAAHAGLSLREAVHTLAFWLIVSAFFLIVAAEAACIVHLVPLLGDRGLAPARAAGLASILGFAIVAGRLVTGYLIDRLPANRVAATLLVLPVVGLAGLAVTHGTAITIGAIILIGLAGGAEIDLLAFLTSRTFGLRHYGTIYGINLTIFAVAAATGPALAGWSFDRTGGYGAAMVAGSAMFIAGSGLLLMLGRRAPAVSGRHGEPAPRPPSAGHWREVGCANPSDS